MKRFNIILVLLFSILSSATVYSQTIKGAGGIVSQNVDMGTITSIGLGISADVYIKQGSRQSIEIKGQQNIIDQIKKTSKGGSWNIVFKRGVRIKNYEDLKIYITMASLEALSIGGSGSIIGQGKFSKLDDLGISIGGSGDINLEVDADEVSCSIGGSGNVKLKGSADEFSISIGGSGDVDAINLSVKECSISSAGSGNIDVNVSDELDISLVGSSDVRYKGKPKIKKSIVGSGDVDPY